MPVRLLELRRSRVFVVAPHMDDEVIGCGGSLLVHRSLGSEVHVAFVSDNTSGAADASIGMQLRALRLHEMETVRARLGVQSFAIYDLPDGSLVKHEAELEKLLVSEIAGFKPDCIFCPFPADGHPDHQACSIALAQAVCASDWKGTVLAYEVWSTLWPNVAVDISRVAMEKDALIRCYASQMEDRDYATAALSLNRYRGLQHKLEYAEAFHWCSAEQFKRLADTLNEV
jgi:LmbE family N-acetylglucosaminyl deacetylase